MKMTEKKTLNAELDAAIESGDISKAKEVREKIRALEQKVHADFCKRVMGRSALKYRGMSQEEFDTAISHEKELYDYAQKMTDEEADKVKAGLKKSVENRLKTMGLKKAE